MFFNIFILEYFELKTLPPVAMYSLERCNSLGQTRENALCLDDRIGDFGDEGLTLLDEIPATGLLDGEQGGDRCGNGSAFRYRDNNVRRGILLKQ